MKILIIQTSFLGDVILATGLVEFLFASVPNVEIHFLVRRGNEFVLSNNPKIYKVWIWDKKQGKYKSLFKLINSFRNIKFDAILNLHRFFNTGLLATLSRSNKVYGFDKNPFSLLYSASVRHNLTEKIGETYQHEVERNLAVAKLLVDTENAFLPKIYPSVQDYKLIKQYQAKSYLCIAPSSIWNTKRWPVEKFVNLINKIPLHITIYLLGSNDDYLLCDSIKNDSVHKGIINLSGKLSIMQSAALISGSTATIANDSAPTHLASAMQAPILTLFCSTIPEFGFGPLGVKSKVLQTKLDLDCRPCGLHGRIECPRGHFKCSEIDTTEIIEWLSLPNY